MANDFMGLGADRKFGFSRMGMSQGEQRQKESEAVGVREGVQNFKRQERMGRRAYRQALRQNDPGRAYDIVKDMGQNGLSSGGIRQAGAVENRLMSQFESRKASLAPAAAPAAPALGTAPATSFAPGPNVTNPKDGFQAVGAQGLPVPGQTTSMSPVPGRGPTMDFRNWEGVQNGQVGDRKPGDGLENITAGGQQQPAQSPVQGLIGKMLGGVQNFLGGGPKPEMQGPPGALASPQMQGPPEPLNRILDGTGALMEDFRRRNGMPLENPNAYVEPAGPPNSPSVLTPGIIASNSAMLNSDRMHERFSLLDQGVADAKAANERAFQQHLDNTAIYNLKQAEGEMGAYRHAVRNELGKAFSHQPKTATPPRPVFGTTADPGLSYKPLAERDAMNAKANDILADIELRLKSRAEPDVDPNAGGEYGRERGKGVRALDPEKEKARKARVAQTQREIDAANAKKSKR